jgi:hypothetical protein
MHLATHPERARLAVPPQTPMDPVGDDVLQAEPTEWFAGAAALPNIHSLFEARSLAALAAQGIQRWLGCGGLMGCDGRLSFSPVSSLGFEVLGELLAANRGFHWLDDTGGSWLVLCSQVGPRDSSRTAFALSWYGQSRLFDPRARHRAIEALETRLATVARPGRRWTAMERTIYGRWAHALRRLQLADIAMQILAAVGGRSGAVEFKAAGVECAAVLGATDSIPLSGDETGDAIRSTTELRIARLSLAPLGWQPRIIQQTSAVTETNRVSADSFRLQMSVLWSEMITAFADAWPATA